MALRRKLEPFGARDSITFFDNHKSLETRSDTVTGYDRLHDRTPYDQTKPRCDRTKQAIIWQGIHVENKSHRIPMIAEHWYGRPNRVQVDFPDGKYRRSNKIRDNFYRRNGTNLSTNNNRELLE